jgi:mannose-6-phosphate isomerase-like protein (cupin superfamily)
MLAAGFLAALLPLPALAQYAAPAAPIQTGNEPGYNQGKGGIDSYPSPGAIRYVLSRDPQDRRIDMFMGDWHESMPRTMHGSMVARDILTKGENFAPPEKGAILQYLNFEAYATLGPGASTPPDHLTQQQEVYYVVGGTGTLLAGGALAHLHKDVAVLMPANLEFTFSNTGDDPLAMYVLNEPVPPGFKVGDKMLVIDERQARIRTPSPDEPYILPGASGHWGHVCRELFARRDGLAAMSSVLTVEFMPMTMGEPHSHNPGQEEIWTQLEGTSLAFESAQLRLQKPGMAYMIRPDGTATHSNINVGDTTIKFLYNVEGMRYVPAAGALLPKCKACEPGEK